MNVQAYIESGIIEAYCADLLTKSEQAELMALSLLYPEIKLELDAVELALEKFAAANAIAPSASAKQRILTSIGAGAMLDLNNLPATDKNSNHEQWLQTLAHLIPDYPTEDFLCEVLQQNQHLTQMLVISKKDVPEETHTDIAESFFILKGHCECMVGDNLYKLTPGIFWTSRCTRSTMLK